MGKTFSYLPYKGEESYAFFGCISADEKIASAVADSLISRKIRLFNEDFDGEFADSADAIANAIVSSDGVIMFLSEKSMNSLIFRNAVNYALSIRKPMICIKLDDSELAHGMEMQLANVKIIKYVNCEQTIEEILSSGIVTQDMIGSGMEKRIVNNKKKYIMAGMIAAAILIFALSASAVVKKRTSTEFILKDVDGKEYVDITPYGEEGIKCLAGKTVKEINMANGGFTNVKGMENVSFEIIDVSDNPDITSLWPLTKVNGIKRVKISQDMRASALSLVSAGIEVEITH